jgi:tetratricopeptide (TPR) repeat protein
MSTRNVARLDSYRSRRAVRLAQAKALYSGDPARAPLVDCISVALATVDGDRGAVLWLDEYGPSIPHVFCLVDVGSHEPRRKFGVDPLREAWDRGVPGLLDEPDAAFPVGVASRSSVTVVLGSDGTRAWFLTIDSLTPRNKLTPAQTDELMFAAGQAGSVVLHRDQGQSEPKPSAGDGLSGWAVLRDLDGKDGDCGLNRRIATRFLVARLVRSAVEADFANAEESLAEQVRSVEREFRVLPRDDREREGWQRVVDGIRVGDRKESASAVLELADQVVSQGHLEGALELFNSAYRVGVASGLPEAVIDGARFQGMVSRRMGNWEGVSHWYDVAEKLAVAFGDDRRLGLVLDGVGASLRVQGRFEEAVERHEEVIEIAERIGDVTLEGFGRHSLMAALRAMGKLDIAIQVGWKAFELHSSSMHRYRVLTTLAGVFLECGDYDSAEHAYQIVLAGSKDVMHRLHALDAVAHINALRGDLEGFRAELVRLDALDWRSSDIHTVATLIYYRGRGLAVLGLEDEARKWLGEATEYCEAHGITEIGRDTAAAIASLDAGDMNAPESVEGIPAPVGAGVDLAPIRAELLEIRRRLPACTA